MKKIILMGELGRKFGRYHSFKVRNGAEAVRALCANFKDFRKHLIDNDKHNVGYKVMLGKDYVSEDKEFSYPLGDSQTIKIIPVIAGSESGTFKVIAGVALIAIGIVLSFTPAAAASPYLIAAGVGMTLSGVIQLLTPIPKIPPLSERDSDKVSYLFNGAVNSSVQGLPVQCVFGRMIVGSSVISAGITIGDITS